MEISCRYLLIRIDQHTKMKKVLYQSNDRQELQCLKGKMESEISIDVFNANTYLIEDNNEYEAKIQSQGIF